MRTKGRWLMFAGEFVQSIANLRLDSGDAAKLLSVDIKTVRRWMDGKVAIPGPVSEVLSAWIKLDRLRIPWRPDVAPVAPIDEDAIAEQLQLYRNEAIELAEILERVEERGGPAANWDVDFNRYIAELPNIMCVFFYPLPNGSFYPSSYSRLDDRTANLRRDWPLVEDAIASIARAIASQKPRKAVTRKSYR